MRELIEFIAKSRVDQPHEVRTRVYERDQQTVIELDVDPADLGKVIGRQGRTARAIRNLLSAAGTKSRRRYSLDIID
jgi:predicted RNA-binding protein YlqC (UPF0109 family)